MSEFKMDEVGLWTEIKLDIIRDYAPASPNKTGAKIVTDIMKKHRGGRPSHGS